jgi:hypothetical protein
MLAAAQHMAFLLQLPEPHNGRCHTLLLIPDESVLKADDKAHTGQKNVF